MLESRGWGPAATPAFPEVLGLLPWNPLGVGTTLAAIAGAIPATVETLRLAATTGTVTQRLKAAKTLRSLTGEEEPLLTVIEQAWARGNELHLAAKAARTREDENLRIAIRHLLEELG